MWSVLLRPLSGSTALMAGAAGAVVSMVSDQLAEAAPVLPAASVALAVKLWPPWASVAVAKLQAPDPLAVVVPSWVAPSSTATVALASALPLSVSVVALVMWSVLLRPLSGSTALTAGAAGAAVSMVSDQAVEAAEMLPAASVALAVKLWPPWARVAVAKLQAPDPLAVVVPSWVAPSSTATVALASAL